MWGVVSFVCCVRATKCLAVHFAESRLDWSACDSRLWAEI